VKVVGLGVRSKRLLDLVLAAIALPFAILVAVPFALAIWLEDRHSPLYGGWRVGKDWKPYRQFKLRSMVPDAEKSGVESTPDNDPRITRLGRIIRQAKVDELPQLLNVLIGNMSFVGPRPNCLRECKMYSEEEKKILTITPGITDISSIVFSDEQQILAGTTDPNLGYHQLVRPWKSRFCILYLENQSLRLDLELILITGLVVFSRRLGLQALQPVLRRLGADDELLQIARRETKLTRYPPPGLSDIVREVLGDRVKILLLNQAFFPDSVATSQYVTDLACELHAQGHEITVLCGRRDYTIRDKLYPSFEMVDGIFVHRVYSTRFGKGNLVTRILDAVTYDLFSLWRLFLLPRHDVVVAFTSPPLVGFYGALTARFWRARFVHWLMNVNHEIAMELGCLRRKSMLGRALTTIYRVTLRSCDRIIVMDRWMKARVVREDVIDPQSIAIVPLWPIHTPDPAAPSEGTNYFRGKHGLGDKFVVVHSGNLSVIHPLDTVLDAAVRLKEDSSVVFVFIGYGARERDINERVRIHGLTNILKLPYQSRELLGSSLGLADLHLVIMGNAASGLAHSSKIYSILATGQPYLFVGPRASHIVSDVIEACPGGFHVENGDVDGFLAVIEKVKRLPAEERARIHSMNRAFVASRFSRKECITSFTEHVGITAMTTLPSVTSSRRQAPSGAQLGGTASNSSELKPATIPR
jgi:colanic acid biosynthesis glycosyl transferase WcaI